MDLREFAKKRKEDPLYGHNDRYRRYIAGQINSLNKDIDDYRSEVNSLYTKHNEREAFYGPEGAGSAGASGGLYRGDAQTNLITVDGYKRRTDTKSAGIRDKLNKYGSYMTSDDVAAITSMLDDTDANIGRLYDAALEEQTVFGGYKDESDYVTKTQAFLDYLDMGEDLTARRGDIRLMDDVLDNPDKQDNYISARYAISKGDPNSQTVGYGSGDALIPSAFTVGGNMNATVNQGRKASDIAYKDALSLVTDENSEYYYKNNPYYNKIYDPNNVTSKSTDALEALRTDTWSQYAADMAGYAPVAALNDEKYAETVNIGKANNPWGEELDFLDPDIADIAYYYLGKGDEETARIVANIPENAPITAYIKGAKWANAVNDIPVIEELAKFGASAIDTVGTAGQKLYNMATQSDDVVTPTRFGYAANIAQSDDTGLKAIFGDAAISLGQMAPSAIAGLAVSAISKNPKLGANVAQTLFGVNAASGAYNEKIEAGWKPSEALTYGVLTGLSEVAVEKILGGSAKLIGGQFADDIAYGINNAVSKLAKNHSDDFMMFLAKGAKVTGSMAQEFLEESVQTVLDPAFELASRGETDGVKFSEVLYAGLTGMITGGLGEAGSAVGSAYHGVRSAVGGVRGAIDTARVGKAVMNTEGGVGTLKTLGEGMSLDSAAHKLANKVTPDTGAYRIGKLYKTVGTQITAENRADIMKSLTRKGVDTATADDLVSAIVDVAQGKELTNAQKALIENNESAVSAAIVNIAENPMSTVNQRTDAYKSVADAVKNAKTTRAESKADSKAAETSENTAAPVASAPSKEAVLKKIPEIISREGGKAPSVLDANNADDFMTAVNAVGEGPRDIVVGDFDGSSADTVTVNGNGRTELSSTGAPVTVAEVASVKNGKVTLKLDDNRVVDASELSYASRDDGLVYEMVSDMSPTTANTFVSDYSVKASDVTLSDYALAWRTAYEYGYRGFDEGEVYGDASVAEALLPAQARHAFAAGRADANAVRGTSRDDIKRGAAEAVKTAENAVRAKSEAKAEAEKKKAADKGGKAKLSDSDPTVKSGRETGAKDSDIELAVMLKKATGREIIFRKDKESLNGEYDGKNTVFVNPDGSDLVHTVLAHEIAHSVEGSKHYSKLVSAAKAVAEARGQKWEDILDEAWDTEAQVYKDNGQTFGSTEAEYEAVAKVISSMFAEEADLRVFIEALDKPTIKVIYDAIGRVIKRLRSFLADRFKYMTDKKNYDEQYRRMQIELQRAERARAVFARALRDTSGSGSGKVRYSYAGEKAQTADKLTLANAQSMLEAGVDPETVRQETGWFKSYDGKWRFEIDDSEATFIDNPKFDIREDDGEIYRVSKLSEIFDHKKLYEAYPELKDYTVIVQKTETGTEGTTFSGDKQIVISDALYKRKVENADRAKEIAAIEATPEFKEYNRFYEDEALAEELGDEQWLIEEKAAMNKFFASEIGKRYYQLMWGKDSKAQYELSWSDRAKEVLLHELQHALQSIEEFAGGSNQGYWTRRIQNGYDAKGRSPGDLYRDTAGEIEARDAANRANLTAEQRKNTRPDNDRSDVVFAEGGNESMSISETTDGRPVVVVNDDITRYATNNKSLVNLVKASISKRPYVAISKQKIFFLADTKDEVTNSNYTKKIRRRKPQIYKDKMRAFNHPSEIILATTNYVNEAPSHERKDNIIDFARGELLLDVHGRKYTANVVIGFTDKGICELHDIDNLKPTKFEYKKRDAGSAISQHSEHSQTYTSLSDTSISHPGGSVNSKNENSRHSSTNGGYGTKPRNKAEELNRIKAQEMLARGENGETVYNETGWFRDKFGNLVVDHEAPVYLNMPASEKVLQFAEHMEAKAAEKTAEAESLREDIRRAKSAIKSDIKATTKPDREYVKGLVNELIPDPADGKYPRRVREKYTDEILALYDRRDDVDSSGVHAMSEDAFEAEIARIVFEMQAEEVTYDERIEIADRVKAELRVPMYVSDTAKGDFSVGEGYAKTRQHYMGRLDLRSDRSKGTPVDVRYMELNGAFPEWFPIDIENEADELRRIMEVADTVFDKSFTEGSIYSELPEAAYVEDAERMKQSIREGYKKLKRIPKTFSDEILQMLESRERRTEEAHKAAMEKLLRKAEWEMVHELRAKEQLLSAVAEDYDKQLADQRAYYEGREADRKKREADKKAAALKRKRDRGLFIDVEKEFAALKDGSFSSEMRKLYERQHQLVAELAPFENIDANKIENEGIREYVKETREKLDNLNAYIRRVGQIQRTLLQKSWLEVLSKHDLAKWKDKRMGLSYQVETMRRNIEDISGGDELGREILKTAIDPIDRHVAEGNKLKNALRARVEALNLDMKPKKGDILSESAFVQLYGEARDNIEMLKNGGGNAVDKSGQPMREGKTLEQWEGILNTILLENPGISGNADTMKRMDEAVKVFSEIYDQLIGMINSVRMLNGYEPVAYHHGYFPHFNNDTGADSTLVLLAKSLGIGEGELDGLPTSINGITRTFRPGIRYMANANQRSVYGIGQEYNGFRLNAGAVEGFDRYIEVAADIIYLTEDVQRLRALSNAIRYATTDKGIKERHDMIDARDDIDIAEKQSLIDTLYSGNQKYALRNFVVELEDYTNILAGKKSNADRDMEQKLGRSFYAFAKKIEGKVAANMVVLNPASWLTNFIPLTQGAAVMPTHMIISSMYDTLRAVRKGDALAASSAFLTNRRGSDMISVKSASQVPARFMEAIDMFTSETLVRARVKQNVKRGMSYADALAEADVFVSKMMAGRSKGAMPTIFHQSNPLTKLFTQFQLEVKNQWSFFAKDMPAEARNNSDTKAEFVGRMIGMMLKYAVGAWLFDELYELLFGRRPGFDPIDIVNEAVGDITGYALPGVGDMAKATFTDATWMDAVKANKVGVGEAGKKFASNVGEQVPFVGGVLFDGGRIPISSALPSMSNVWDAMTNTKAAPSKRAIELAEELSKPLYYTVLPFGGSMVKKAVEGTEAIVRGGSYKLDKDGNEILQYPVYNDNAVDVAKNVATTLLSGKSATEGGREWIESGFNSLSAKETARYQALIKSGMSQRDAYEAIRLTSDPKALYDIMISGDSEQITKAKSGFKDEKAYEAALRAAITEHDPRIMEAVRLQIAGDVSGRVAIQKEIIGEGHFKMGVVTAAVNNAVTSFNGSVRSAAKAKLAGDVNEYQKIINELVNDKGYTVETVSSALGEDVAELLEAPDAVGDEETLYTASDISTAFKSGDVSGAYAAITEHVSVKTANYIADGKTPEEAEKSAKSTAKSQVTKSFKEDYKAAYANGDYDEMDRIAKIIYGTGLYEYLYEVDSLTFKWQREYDEDNEQ